MPKISVCIASYNHERYVRAAIESVLMQSLADVELCITDDGSPDGTADVIAGMGESRIHLNRLPDNVGAAAALNDAIRRSTGEYIAVLNSDDVFLSDKLRSQAEFLDAHPDVGAVFGYPTFIDDSGNEISADRTFYGKIFEVEYRNTEDWLRHFFYFGNCLCHPTAMIRKACYGEVGLYDERFAQLPDFDMWLRLLPRYRIMLIPEPVLLFRIVAGEGNASAPRPAVTNRMVWEHEKVMRHFISIEDSLFQSTFGDDLARRDVDRNLSRSAKLGLLALDSELLPVKRFGIEQLFSSIAPQSGSTGCRTGFSAREFIRLTGETDLYGHFGAASAIGHLYERIAVLERERVARNAAPTALASHIGWLSRLRGTRDRV